MQALAGRVVIKEVAPRNVKSLLVIRNQWLRRVGKDDEIGR